ncbi:MAG: sulfatase [Thermoanaerobaculia bacterium]|nr:sulfatase [Thermoanaerobaculia bacterium]
MPIHLEDRLGSARIEGAEEHEDLAKPLRWEFGGEAPTAWKALPTLVDRATPVELESTGGGLRVRLTATSRAPQDPVEVLHGGIFLEVPAFDPSAWRRVEIEARASGPVRWVGIGYNVRDQRGESPDDQWPTQFFGTATGVQADGELHTYRTDLVGFGGPVTEPVRQIAIELGAGEPAELEIRSITLVPAGAAYAGAGTGIRSVSSSQHEDFGPQRRAIYAHTPARISYSFEVPSAGRLDLALGAFHRNARMAIEVDDGASVERLLDEIVAPLEAWRQHSVDLSRWSGSHITLTLVSEADEPAISFWASPTVSGTTEEDSVAAKPPNVIFYVIDGASAGHMSLYGYERPTTPNLERIAAEGVVFDRAYSNSTWTMPSTASFMTSLHHSVLGGLRDDANPIPVDAKTMAEHFHDAGFHTGVFTFNPNAGSLSGLERGVDVFRDFGKRGAPLDPIEAISSKVLQGQFWRWRDAYPGPYWAHFQTTDVHPPHHPQEPFAGRFVPKEQSRAFTEQMLRMRFPFNHTSASVHEHWQAQLAEHDLDPQEFYTTLRDMHDEAMLHQDHQLGELVKELKARGEWQNTLLVIGSDHGHPAASYPRFGRGLLDPQPEAWQGALFGEFQSHIPLIVVWPGRIEGGRRIEHAVSMIDVLPTILDLAALPQPEIAQGQSLAPLLLNDGKSWEPAPVVFDEFRLADDGSLVGNLEILDGRWGRSLEIRTADHLSPPATGRHPAPAGGRWRARQFDEISRLLIYDVEADPRAVQHVAEPNPKLVGESERRLWLLWKKHLALAAEFEAGEEADLSPEQVEALKALGYVE